MWGRFLRTAKTSQSPLSTNADTAYYKTLSSKQALTLPCLEAYYSCGHLNAEKLFKLRGQLRSLANKQARRESNLQFRNWQNFKTQAYPAFD